MRLKLGMLPLYESHPRFGGTTTGLYPRGVELCSTTFTAPKDIVGLLGDGALVLAACDRHFFTCPWLYQKFGLDGPIFGSEFAVGVGYAF
jgi:hypothetical protein